MTLTELNEAIAKKILIPNFQRDFNNERVRPIIESSKSGRMIPPIMVGIVEGEYILIDGQHRLAAWEKEHYPLQILSYPTTPDDAVKDFVVMNSRHVRVGLKHRLKVDTSNFAMTLRKVAVRYNTEHVKVHGICAGLQGEWGKYEANSKTSTKMIFDRADEILKVWSNSPLWGVLSTETYYHSQGILKMIGFISRHKFDANLLEKLKKMDFSRDGFFSECYSNNSIGVKRMFNAIEKKYGINLHLVVQETQKNQKVA